VLAASIVAFLVAITVTYPIQILPASQKANSQALKSDLDLLIAIRLAAQSSSLANSEYEFSKWKNELAIIQALHLQYGLSVLPLIDYLIACERDDQTLSREFQNRSATAKGASLTLMMMPVLMWTIGVAIGIDVFNFLVTIIGIALLGAGFTLTLVSRMIIRSASKLALNKPSPRRPKSIPALLAALLTFLTVFAFQTNYLGFMFGSLLSIFVHEFWQRIPVRDEKIIKFILEDNQHFKIQLLAGMIDVGFPWARALHAIDDLELKVIANRIDMGVSAALAFELSEDWRRIGVLISLAIEKGSQLSSELRMLSDEYRQSCLAFRIEQCEKVAGRLIIPVNLLQLPAFLLTGLVPMIGPLFMQTFETFHI
jgi:hypothetical protein